LKVDRVGGGDVNQLVKGGGLGGGRGIKGIRWVRGVDDSSIFMSRKKDKKSKERRRVQRGKNRDTESYKYATRTMPGGWKILFAGGTKKETIGGTRAGMEGRVRTSKNWGEREKGGRREMRKVGGKPVENGVPRRKSV